MVNSRNKGAQFERDIAGMLNDELGITFRRDLDQYRERDRGDLIPDTAFPFLIECKRYGSGGFQNSWWKQAEVAALAARKDATDKLYPAVIWKIDRQPIRVTVSLQSVMECASRQQWSAPNARIDMDFTTFCYVAREGLADG